MVYHDLCGMPFLRIEKKKSGTYLRILESYRNAEGKSTHRTLYSLGKVSDYTPLQLRRIGVKFFELGSGEIKNLIKGELVELGRYNYGYQQIYGKAVSYFGLDHVMRRLQKSSRIQFNLANVVMLMLIERLQEPCSKLKNFEHQEEYLNFEKVELHHLYRALDVLAKHNELIQRQIYQVDRDLFNNKLDVVFYDVTTFYFDSEVEKEGQLRQMGFGKDGKIGRTQILFSMLIDKDKRPIGYRIFKGDTYEGNTFKVALEDLKTRFDIDKVIVVADRGMLSKANIQKVIEADYEYIIGERLKSLPRKIKEILLDKDGYQSTWVYIDNQDQPVNIKYTTLEYNDKTIICTYSEKRANKDKHDRLERLEKAEKLLKSPASLDKKSSRYFIKTNDNKTYQLDEEKIANHAKYDGLMAISTNTMLKAEDVLEQYKQLYRIEHSFRTMKSHLEVRPMYHWTDSRIEGHICMCYMAFSLQNWVLLKANTNKKKEKFTERKIRAIMSKMQVSLIQNNEDLIYVRSKPQDKEIHLQQQIGVKPLMPMTPTSKMTI